MGNSVKSTAELEEEDLIKIENTGCFDDEILIEGHLSKESTYLKKLKKRWYALKGNHLYRWKTQKDYDSNMEPEKIINLKVYNDIIISQHKNLPQFELVSSNIQSYSNRALIAESIDDMNRWMSTIHPLLILPHDSIYNVFERISKNVGIDNENNSFNAYTQQLCNLWYYRAIDLLNINEQLLNELRIPITLQNQVNEYIKIWKKYTLYTRFKEPVPEQNNIKHILNELKSENESDSTARDIQILIQTFEDVWLLNINKIKLYFSKQDWDKINVPQYLKIIVLNKIHHKLNNDENKQEEQKEGEVDHEEKEDEQSILYPDIQDVKQDIQQITDDGRKRDDEKINIDVTQISNDDYDIDGNTTLIKIRGILALNFFIDEDDMKTYFQVFLDYKYNRMYHLSLMSDNLYKELMVDAPKCLRLELYGLMMKCNDKMAGKTLMFEQKEEFDWTMTTDKVFKLLENDLNLKQDELKEDCDVLMNNFYSNLWDWFFVPIKIWKSMKYYNKFHIVRRRIHDLMNQCAEKYNLNQKMPKLPDVWVHKYNKDISIEQLFFGGVDEQFSFDGLQWNEYTTEKVQLINRYMLDNYVGKLQFITDEHVKNVDVWSTYMNDNGIPQHIRFKIMFYAIKGNMQTDDDWINNYIQNNYPTSAPQFNQSILVPMFFVQDVTDVSAKIKFYSAPDFDCYIEIACEEEKESNWNELIVINNTKTKYICNDLRRHTSYKLRAKYVNHTTFTEVVPFKTRLPDPPVFVVEDINSSSITMRFGFQSALECDVEIMDGEGMKSTWQHLETFKNQIEYDCSDLRSNNSYQIRARYKDEFVCSNFSQPISFHTLPQRPKMAVQNLQSTSAQFTFSNMSSLACVIEMTDEKSSNWNQITTFSNKNSYLCENLEPNHSYQAKAKYKSELAESFYCKRHRFTTLPNPPLLSITNVTETSATLKLLDAISLDCKVEIMDESKSIKNWTSCDRWGSFLDERTYSISNLKSGTTFQIRGRYKNKSGYSEYCDAVSFDTLPEPPVCSIENITETTATMRFGRRYQLPCYIERYDETQSVWNVIKVITNDISYELDDLQPNEHYKVRAKLKGKNRFSDCSQILVFTTTPMPPTFSMENVNDTNAQLKLPMQSDMDCHIEIAEDNGNDDCKWNEFGTFSNTNIHLCSNLKYNTTYKIRTKYENVHGCSSFSQIMSFKTRLPDPPVFVVEKITSRSAILKFSDTFILDLECSVEIAFDEEKQADWNESGTFSNTKTYICSSLQRDKSYKIRAKYKDYQVFSDIQTFHTTAGWSDILNAEECTKLEELVNNHTENGYKEEWICLYRASEHGFTSQAFYDKCHMKSNTICIIEDKKSHNIFGGFTTSFWDKQQANINEQHVEGDSEAFTYLIRSNQGLEAAIFPVKNAVRSAIIQQSEYFLMFGDGASDDANVIIQLSDDCNINEESYGYIDEKGDESYVVPNGYQLTEDGFFTVENVEVFQLISKIRKYNRGNKTRWENNRVEDWNNNDIIHWLTSIGEDINDNIYYAMINEIKDCQCIGEDLICIENAEEFGDSFGIINNEILCQKLFENMLQLNINYEWKMTPIELWRNENVLSWINSMNINEEYNAMIISVITDAACEGEDIIQLENAQEIGDAFGIDNNKELCDQLFEAIESVKTTQLEMQQNNNNNNNDHQRIETPMGPAYVSELNYSWKQKRIRDWSNIEILDWIKCMNLNTEWNNKILNVIEMNECIGEDIIELKTSNDWNEAFEIDNDEISNKICNEMKNFRPEGIENSGPEFKINICYNNREIQLEEEVIESIKIRKIKEMFQIQMRMDDIELKHIHFKYKKKELKNNKTLQLCGIINEEHLIIVKLDDVFVISMYAQGNNLTLNKKVTKTYRIKQIKKMYKKQSGVHATLDEIKFYTKNKLLNGNKTLEQCGIVDDRHLISVKFETDGGGK